MAELVRAGKVRFIGLSEAAPSVVASSWDGSVRPTTSSRTTSGETTRGSKGRTSGATSSWSSARELAAAKGVTPAQLALAWVLGQGTDVVPIPGTRHTSYLEQNVGALTIELSADDLDRIEQAFPRGATAGDRYPNMSTIGL